MVTVTFKTTQVPNNISKVGKTAVELQVRHSCVQRRPLIHFSCVGSRRLNKNYYCDLTLVHLIF